jgi:hypothetical protein
MTFPTRKLTQEAAINAAVAASLVTRRQHVAYKLRNGTWKWGRFGFLKVAYLAVAARVYFVVGRNGLFTEVKRGSQS